MANHDYYDGSQLQQAFKVAHSGMEVMFLKNPEFGQAHLDSAQAFINGCDLFAAFKSETPVGANYINTQIQKYFDTRPDQEMHAASSALAHRWVSAYAEEIRAINAPNGPKEETPHPALAKFYPAKFTLAK